MTFLGINEGIIAFLKLFSLLPLFTSTFKKGVFTLKSMGVIPLLLSIFLQNPCTEFGANINAISPTILSMISLGICILENQLG